VDRWDWIIGEVLSGSSLAASDTVWLWWYLIEYVMVMVVEVISGVG
jgi:hypothetical protein